MNIAILGFDKIKKDTEIILDINNNITDQFSYNSVLSKSNTDNKDSAVLTDEDSGEYIFTLSPECYKSGITHWQQLPQEKVLHGLILNEASRKKYES